MTRTMPKNANESCQEKKTQSFYGIKQNTALFQSLRHISLS